EFNKTEDDLKSLQIVGQIIGEVLRPLDNERSSSGPRYVVGCRSKVDKEKLISATRVSPSVRTAIFTPDIPSNHPSTRETKKKNNINAFTQHLSMYAGDAEEIDVKTYKRLFGYVLLPFNLDMIYVSLSDKECPLDVTPTYPFQ
ncbi:hypothetical protein HID58_006871, partial [Brassica napus]